MSNFTDQRKVYGFVLGHGILKMIIVQSLSIGWGGGEGTTKIGLMWGGKTFPAPPPPPPPMSNKTKISTLPQGYKKYTNV